MELENVFGSSPREQVLKNNFFIRVVFPLTVLWPGFLNNGRDEFPKFAVYFEPLKEFSLILVLHVT